jgi:CheY-like chemotaxis protein
MGRPSSIKDRIWTIAYSDQIVRQPVVAGASGVEAGKEKFMGNEVIQGVADARVGIPLCQEQGLAGTDSQPERGSAMPDRRARRVLVVDDHAAVRDFSERALRRLGYEVSGVATGGEATSVLAAGARFDAVLSDIVMAGGTDGYALAAWIRTERPGLPVVLMTGYAEAAVADAAGLPILRKPFRRADLAAAIERAVGTERDLF